MSDNTNEQALPTNNANKPAFPITISSASHCLVYTGLTKREHLASLIIQGLVARGGYEKVEYLTGYALKIADALLERLEK